VDLTILDAVEKKAKLIAISVIELRLLANERLADLRRIEILRS
jgi:hypothetical protein